MNAMLSRNEAFLQSNCKEPNDVDVSCDMAENQRRVSSRLRRINQQNMFEHHASGNGSNVLRSHRVGVVLDATLPQEAVENGANQTHVNRQSTIKTLLAFSSSGCQRTKRSRVNVKVFDDFLTITHALIAVTCRQLSKDKILNSMSVKGCHSAIWAEITANWAMRMFQEGWYIFFLKNKVHIY